MKFSVFDGAHGFNAAIGKVIEADMPTNNAAVIDKTMATEKLQAKAKKRNEVATANLTMAFQSAGLIGMVNALVNTAWPSRLVCRIVGALHSRFVPHNRISRVEM